MRHLIWVYTVCSGMFVPMLWVIKVHFCHCRVFRKLQGQVHSVSLKGVEDAYSKHTDDKSEPKGIKAHFKMDENGILSLEQVSRYFVCGRSCWPSQMGILIIKLRVRSPPRMATFLWREWSWNIFYSHSFLSANSRWALSVSSKRMCTSTGSLSRGLSLLRKSVVG